MMGVRDAFDLSASLMKGVSRHILTSRAEGVSARAGAALLEESLVALPNNDKRMDTNTKASSQVPPTQHHHRSSWSSLHQPEPHSPQPGEITTGLADIAACGEARAEQKHSGGGEGNRDGPPPSPRRPGDVPPLQPYFEAFREANLDLQLAVAVDGTDGCASSSVLLAILVCSAVECALPGADAEQLLHCVLCSHKFHPACRGLGGR